MKEKIDEIYKTLGPNYPCDKTCEITNYICDNLEEIQKLCGNAKINNIIERIRLITDISTGRFPELYEKIKTMTTEEFIEFAGNHEEQQLFSFSSFWDDKYKRKLFENWEKLEFCKSLKGGFNEKEDITRLFEYQ